MKKNKILFIGSYYPTMGGAEKYLYEICSNIDDSYILCPNVKGDYTPRDPCKVYRASSIIKDTKIVKKINILEYVQNYSFIPFAIRKGARIIKNEKIEVIHAQMGLSFGIVGYKLKKKTKKPLVLTLHGSGFNFSGWKKVLKPMVKKILLSADKIVAVSGAILKEAKEVANIDGEVIYNSVNLNEFENKGDKKYILAVGRLAKMKGFDVLVKAAKELPEYNFIIVGEGPERKTLEDIITKEKIKNVKLVGQKTSNEVREYMSNCSIFAMPSLFGEGLPFALVEAISSGKAVIGTRVRGIPEVIHKNGILIEPNNIDELEDAIKELMTNTEKRQNMEKEAIKFSKKSFDFDKNLKRLNDIYKSVIKP